MVQEIVSNISTKRLLITLEGQLGAGKTTLTKQIIQYFGGSPEMVTSPTFSIVNEYEVTHKQYAGMIHHLDLYRLKNEDEILSIGFDELVHGNEIVIVEWPEKAMSMIDVNTISVTFSQKKSGREVCVKTIDRQ